MNIPKLSVEEIKALDSWEKIAAACGVDPVGYLPYPNAKENDETGEGADEVACNAFKKLSLISKLCNQGEKFDFDTKPAYFGVRRKRPAGFGFDGVDTGYDYTSTHVGPRLSFLNEDLCEYVHTHPETSKIFDDLFNQD